MFESDYDAVANDVANNNDSGSIQIRGIYQKTKNPNMKVSIY